MNLKEAMGSWDEKSVDYLGEIYHLYSQFPEFVDDLLASMESTLLQKGTTWLLKRHLESGGILEKAQVGKFLSLLAHLREWESRLHALQSIPYLQIHSSHKADVESFLRDCLTRNQKFVRAWAYNGFYHLALQHPEYQEETMQLLETAMRDEAASVQARIRNILKRGF